jgi:phosphoglycolate phosphatase
MQHYKLVIFDWDGTLMDSVGRIVSCMQSAARIVGLSIPSNDEVKQIIGLSIPEALKELFEGITDKEIEIMRLQYKHQYIEGDDTPTPLFEHAINLLSQLREDNKLLAVATGKGREGLNRVLHISETNHFFHTTRCAGEEPSKPNPQMLHSILTELDIAPHEAIMIGDTSHDLKMAQNAGIDSIGVTFGVHDKQVLEQYSPKTVVDSLSELHQLLLG